MGNKNHSKILISQNKNKKKTIIPSKNAIRDPIKKIIILYFQGQDYNVSNYL